MHLFKKNKNTTALVLSGGGGKGSYQVGVWKAIKESDINIDFVCGTSVGAINAAMVCLDDYDNAEHLWQTLETDEIFDIDTKETTYSEFMDKNFANLWSMPINELHGYAKEFFSQGGASSGGMTKLIHKYISEDKFRKSKIDYGLVTVEFPSLKGHKLFKKDIPQGKIGDFIQASASCFPIAQAFEIDGKKYIDGGFSDNLPVSMAIDKKADRIICVDLEAVGTVINKDLEEAKSVSDFSLIRSNFDLGHFLNFDPIQANYNIRYGYLDGLKSFGKLDGQVFAFEKNSIDKDILADAESAATIFKAEPTEIYTEKTLIDELKMKVLDEQVNIRKSAFHNFSFNDIVNINAIKQSFSDIYSKVSPQALTVFIAESISEEKNEFITNNKVLHQMFAKEFSAAKYLVSRNIIFK